MRFPRACPFALLLVCAAFSQAQGDAPSPIFAVPPADSGKDGGATEAHALLRLPTSERLRTLIAAQLLERAEVFPKPDAPTPRSEPGAVMLEKFVVESRPLRVIELHAPDPRLWHFLKTGNVFRLSVAGLQAEGNMKFFMIEPVGTRLKEYTRAELQFSFAW